MPLFNKHLIDIEGITADKKHWYNFNILKGMYLEQNIKNL